MIIKAVGLILLLTIAAPDSHKDTCVRVCKEASVDGKYVRKTSCGCICIDNAGEFEVMLYDCPEYSEKECQIKW